jgi:hypothetical protein
MWPGEQVLGAGERRERLGEQVGAAGMLRWPGDQAQAAALPVAATPDEQRERLDEQVRAAGLLEWLGERVRGSG